MRALSLTRWVVVVLLSALLVGPALLVHLGGRTIVEVTGGSMSPTLEVGDVVLIRPLEMSTLKPGDIVTVRSGEGGYVTHRVTGIGADGGLSMKGDANLFADSETRSPTEVLGVLDTVIRMPWGIVLIQLQQWPLRISLLVTILGLAFLPLRSLRDENSANPAAVDSTDADVTDAGPTDSSESTTDSPFHTSELTLR